MFVKILKNVSRLATLTVLILGMVSHHANAVFIDFDDIVAPPANPFDCPTPATPCGLILSDEYESKGIIFGIDSWLMGETLPDGSNKNRVVGLNTISLSFTDLLPNFISFNINSALDHEASYIEVWGKNGYLFTHITSGWRGIDEATPYIPDEFVSFYSSEPIAHINITSHYNHRLGPDIDNLTFESREVPEPSPFLLFIPGIIALMWKRAGVKCYSRE